MKIRTVIVATVILFLWAVPDVVLAANEDVLVFYFPWYQRGETDGSGWYKWNGCDYDTPCSKPNTCPPTRNPALGDISSPFYPLLSNLGPYDSSDKGTIARHMGWIETTANIGVVVISWWGRGEGWRNRIDDNTKLVFDWIKDNNSSLKVAIMRDEMSVDPTAFAGTNDDPPVAGEVDYIFNTYVNQYPDIYWKIDGKAVVFHYGDGSYNEDAWQKAYGTIRDKHWVQVGNEKKPVVLLFANGSQDFHKGTTAGRLAKLKTANRNADGLFLWSIVEDNETMKDCAGTKMRDVEFYKTWTKEIHGLAGKKYAIPTVSPGFDNRLHQGCPDKHKWVPRNQPAGCGGDNTYDYTWQCAKGSTNTSANNPDFIVITSFNIWVEAHQIEPAMDDAKRSDGTYYIDYDGQPLRYLTKTKRAMSYWHGYTQ